MIRSVTAPSISGLRARAEGVHVRACVRFSVRVSICVCVRVSVCEYFAPPIPDSFSQNANFHIIIIISITTTTELQLINKFKFDVTFFLSLSLWPNNKQQQLPSVCQFTYLW